MKTVFLILFGFFVAAGAWGQQIQVQASERPDTDFSKWKTYAFTSQVDDQLDAGFFFLNDLILKSQMRDAIDAELQGLGYRKASSKNADILVNFRVFEQPATIQGFEGLGTNYWSGSEARGPLDQVEYKVQPGTIMIHLLDRNAGQVVWQGFASGLIDNGKFMKDKANIHKAANLLFEEYGRRADGLSRR